MEVVTQDSEGNDSKLWEDYRQNSDTSSRLKIIDRYISLARSIAAKLYRERPDEVGDFSDYYHYAVVGLLESIERYDATQGVLFSTFAGYRIKGSILNGIQKFSERREQIANQVRLRKERLDSLKTYAEHKDDTFSEMAELTIGLALGCLLDDSGMIQKEESKEAGLYEKHVLYEIKRGLNSVLEVLPQREQTILRYHYYHQVPFNDLVGILNISKGRISQLHQRALMMLRNSMHEWFDFNQYY